MSQNLLALRQRCLPPPTPAAAQGGQFFEALFPLEKLTPEGHRLERRADAFSALPGYPEVDLQAFKMTYLDSASGLTLPVFAAFRLDGPARLVREVGPGARETKGESPLGAALPWDEVRCSHEEAERRRHRAGRFALWAAWTLWALYALVGLGASGHAARLARAASEWEAYQAWWPADGGEPVAFDAWRRDRLDRKALREAQQGGWITRVVGLAAWAGLGLLALLTWRNAVFGPRLLTLEARFDGLLPPETREKAKAAEKEFEALYLVTDQQGRWDASWAPVATAPRADPDPLLVGSKRIKGQIRHFLIDAFELTTAERYVLDEFCEARHHP